MTEMPDADPMPVFTIKADDVLAVRAIRMYLDLCDELGLVDHRVEVRRALIEVEDWRRQHRDQLRVPYHVHKPAGSQ
jgi:hypothetical protein